VALRDPHVPGAWGFCPFLALTGRPCPLCGGLRAVYDLAHGRPLDAISSNLVVGAALVAGVVVLPWWAARRATGTGFEPPPLPAGWAGWRAGAAGAVLLLAFGVARWFPAFAWATP
jgi:hypothetical protein